MDKTFGYYIFGGVLIGALFGLIWATGSNPLVGLGMGAMVGAFIGGLLLPPLSSKGRRENSRLPAYPKNIRLKILSRLS